MPDILKKTKAIAWAFPTSTNAEFLSCEDTGCYYVSETVYLADGSAHTCVPHDAEGFYTPDHADLIALYNETDAEHCRHFLAHGNELALVALGLRMSDKTRDAYRDYIGRKLSAENVDPTNREASIAALEPCVCGASLVKAYRVIYCGEKLTW